MIKSSRYGRKRTVSTSLLAFFDESHSLSREVKMRAERSTACHSGASYQHSTSILCTPSHYPCMSMSQPSRDASAEVVPDGDIDQRVSTLKMQDRTKIARRYEYQDRISHRHITTRAGRLVTHSLKLLTHVERVRLEWLRTNQVSI